jgi:hypothetical protein
MSRSTLVTLVSLLASTAAFAGECDGLEGCEQLECFRAHHTATYRTVEVACANAERKRTCRQEVYAAHDLTFVPKKRGQAPQEGKARKPINKAAITAAVMTLSIAGATMQQIPSICSSPKARCKINAEEQALVAAFGTLVATEVTKMPEILAGPGSDSDKATAVFGVLENILDKAPQGLGPQAEGYIRSGLTVVETLVGQLI